VRPDIGPVVVSVAALVALVLAAPADAQHIEVAGGVNVGSIPRAENPLCRSARRLTGPGLSVRASVALGSLRLGAGVDHVTNGGVTEVADCVPRTGVSVDSVFAPAGRSATTISASAWLPALRVLRVGAEAGWVLDHSSWFVGPAVGARYRMLALEVAARRHATSFDEVTTDFGPPTVRELSRQSLVESSWGLIARLLLTTN
jgi:hypothetical protein